MGSNRVRTVFTDKAPKPVGAYSQATIANGIIFVSGQIPLDPKTHTIHAKSPIEFQTRLVLKNMEAVLHAAGAQKKDVAKVDVFMTDMEAFGEMNKVYSEFFEGHVPARVAIEVSRLPKDVGVEVQCMAILPKTDTGAP